MVSLGAGAREEAGSTKSIPSEYVDGTLTSAKSDSPEPSKSQEAKSPVASTPNPPEHSLETPSIMTEQSKSSNSSTASEKAKAAINKVLNMTMTSKRGRDTRGNYQEEPNEGPHSKRRMLKMPISRPNLTTLVPKKETVPLQPPPSGKPQTQSSSSSSPVSASTLSHARPSQQQASPRQSKRKQRSSPGEMNGRTVESSPKSASQQTKRKRQSPGEQPTFNERPKLQNSPDTKKRKANESISTQAQSSPTNRRPKMRFGQAAFAGMMNHLGMSGGGISAKQMSQREDGRGGGGESFSSLPTFDDSESPQSPKQRASPEKAAAHSKAKANKNNKKGSKGADVGSVTYHFSIDDNDSPSLRGRGRAAKNSAKPKPNQNNRKEGKAAGADSVTYHFTIDDHVSPSPRGRGRAAAQNSTQPKPNNKKSKGQRKKKRF